jgi:hypothetical protein
MASVGFWRSIDGIGAPNPYQVAEAVQGPADGLFAEVVAELKTTAGRDRLVN